MDLSRTKFHKSWHRGYISGFKTWTPEYEQCQFGCEMIVNQLNLIAGFWNYLCNVLYLKFKSRHIYVFVIFLFRYHRED